MTTNVFEFLEEENPQAVILRDFYEAIVGVAPGEDGLPVLVYSTDEIFRLLQSRDKMSYADAMVYLEALVSGLHVVRHKPVFLKNFSQGAIDRLEGALTSNQRNESSS